MNTHSHDRGPAEGLEEFPQELQAALGLIQGRQAPGSLIERITQNALALENPGPPMSPMAIETNRARMSDSRSGLIYAISALALTAFLTFGFFSRDQNKIGPPIASGPDEVPVLSAIAVLPLLQWDRGAFEKDLKRMEAELSLTNEAVQARAIREEIDRVLAEFKR